ncbi:MAG: AEC family transporter [Firmicutes bacterium]|nr:AEC family transporter [Bacillota bacterium]
MEQILEMQATLFILIFVGFFLKKGGLISNEGQKNLTDLVIYIILPCNILTSFVTGSSEEFLRDGIAILLISVGIQFFCIFYGKLVYRRQSKDRQACLQYGTICSNAGYLGNAIAENAYGPSGLMYASVYLIPQRIMMWSEGLAIYSGTKNRKATIKKVLTHPSIIACELGTILLLTGMTLPAVIMTPLSTIGRCCMALSMIVTGMILTEIHPRSLLDKTLLWYSLNRLVIIPLIVYGVCLLLPISPLARGVSVLLAAMPAGTFTSILALKYDRDPAFATELVIVSTLLSIPAIMVWSMILR